VLVYIEDKREIIWFVFGFKLNILELVVYLKYCKWKESAKSISIWEIKCKMY